MAISNDIDLEPDMAKLTITKPTKSTSVDITKLPIDGPGEPGASSKPLRYTKVRPPKDPFIKRKKPVQRTIEEIVRSTQFKEDHVSLEDTAPTEPQTFFFTPAATKEQSAAQCVDNFPNLTNPVSRTGPDYDHRPFLASKPKPLPHCQAKAAPEKCHDCLLHDLKISDARLKQAMIQLADAEIIAKSKTSKAEDKLQKKAMEWVGERNLLIEQREDAVKGRVEKGVKEAVKEAKREWEETYVTKKKYYEMKEGLELKYNQVEDQLVELRSKVFRL